MLDFYWNYLLSELRLLIVIGKRDDCDDRDELYVSMFCLELCCLYGVVVESLIGNNMNINDMLK